MPTPRKTRKPAAGKAARQNPLKLPGEKSIKPAKSAVPLRPTKLTREQRTPMPEPAVDHRRQVLDDEPRG